MGPTRSHLSTCVGFAVACVMLLLSSSATAQGWDSFPTINEVQRAGIIKRYDSPRYMDLRRCLRRFDSKVGAEYYAAIVDITDPSGSRSGEKTDGDEYAKALAEHWAADSGLPADKHVLVVLGIQNNSLGIDVGTEFRKVGFEGAVVRDTVAASEYSRFMRRRDYGDAICSLATAIDFRLAALEKTMERRIEEVGAKFPEVEKDLTALNKRVAKTFEKDRPYSAGIRDDLGAAEKSLAEAKEKLEDDPAAAVRLVDRARDSMASAETALDRYDDGMERLKAVVLDLEKAQTEISDRDDFDWEGPQQASKRLNECDSMVAGIRDELQGDPADIRTCIAEVRGMLAAADVRHDYLAGTIPLIFTVFFILVALATVTILFLRRRRRTRLLDQDLAEWERRLNAASLRANGLVERFPDYFALGDVAWQGESADLDARTADSVNRAFFLLERGTAILKQARADRGKGHPLSVLPLESSAILLREAASDLPAGSVVGNSPIDVPTTNSYSGTSVALLGDLQDALRESEALLVESATVLEKLATATEAGDQAERETLAAVSERQSLGLAADHLLAPLDEARSEWKQAKEFTRTDPLRSSREGVLETAREKVLAIRDRAVRGNEVVTRIRGELSNEHNAMRHAVAQLGGDGYSLSETNFDARQAVAELQERAKDLVRRVEAGDERRAIAEFDDVLEQTKELSQRIDVTREARDLVPVMRRFLDELREAVRADILKLRIGIGKLPDGAIPKAQLDELTAFQTTLGRVNGELTRLDKAHSEQAYLAATAQVHRIMGLMTRGLQLVNGLAGKSGVTLQNTPAEIAPPEDWENSTSAAWKSDAFGAKPSARNMF